MTKYEHIDIVDKFINDLMTVQHLQEWLINTAIHLRESVVKGDADPGLLPMAEYFEKQSDNLKAFVKELDNAPNIQLEKPVAKAIDPNLN